MLSQVDAVVERGAVQVSAAPGAVQARMEDGAVRAAVLTRAEANVLGVQEGELPANSAHCFVMKTRVCSSLSLILQAKCYTNKHVGKGWHASRT